MKTELLSGTLCGAMVLFAPWQLNVLFYVWLAAAVLRTQSKIKRAEEAAIRISDGNKADLNAMERMKMADKAMKDSRGGRANRFMSADKYMQHQQDKHMQHQQHQKDKQTQHQQHQQDKHMQHQQEKQHKQDKLDHLAQRKSADQATAERGFVTNNNMLFK